MVCQNCGAEIANSQMKFCTVCGAKIEPVAVRRKTDAHDICSVWPEWELRSQIGKGPGSVVYQAVRKDDPAGSRAAVKVVSVPADPSDVAALMARGVDSSGAERFYSNVVNDYVNNVRQQQTFNGSKNSVRVDDCAVVKKAEGIGWDIYIRMELLTPFSAISFGQNISEAAVIKLGIDLCAALETYGRRQIVHGNIKPENIFIDSAGNYKLSDFGSALKRNGLPSPNALDYSAPEVAAGGQSDARADIYSVGLVLYQLLNAGRLPFEERQNRQNAVQQRLHAANLPAPCQASAQMAQLLARACANDPNGRFDFAVQLKDNLICVARGTYCAPVQTGTVRSGQGSGAAAAQTPAQKSKKMNVALIIVLSLAILASLTLVGFAIFMLSRNNSDVENQEQMQTIQETEPVRMPDCVGMHYAYATEYFDEFGYTVTFEYAFSDEYEEGYVIEQSVPEGIRLSAHDVIVLVVSKGRDISPEGYNQKLVVTAADGSSYATMTLYQWENGEWTSLFSCDATVGQRGIGSDYGEGKKKTPEGIFKLGIALSANSIPNSEWPFQRVTSDTCVVDDTDSGYYNTIQSIRSLPSGVHYDPIGNTLVKGYSNVCIYIEHNGNGLSTEGVETGKGSVITVCGRSSAIAPTLGCVDISSSNMNTLLSLLDYSKDPHIEIAVQ